MTLAAVVLFRPLVVSRMALAEPLRASITFVLVSVPLPLTAPPFKMSWATVSVLLPKLN